MTLSAAHEPMSLRGIVTRDALLMTTYRRGMDIIQRVKTDVQTDLIDAAKRDGVRLTRSGTVIIVDDTSNGDALFTVWCCTEHAQGNPR